MWSTLGELGHALFHVCTNLRMEKGLKREKISPAHALFVSIMHFAMLTLLHKSGHAGLSYQSPIGLYGRSFSRLPGGVWGRKS